MTHSNRPPSLRDDPNASRLMIDLLDDARTAELLDAAAVDRVVAHVEALGLAQATPPRSSRFALKTGLAAMLVTISIGLGARSFTPAATPMQEAPRVVAASAEATEGPPEAPAPPQHSEPATDIPTTAPTAVPEPAFGPSEGALLLAARVALRGTNPSRALALTAQHEARFPRGAMREERDVIAIEALMQLGERPRAERRKYAFLARYPSSPYRARIDALFDTSR